MHVAVSALLITLAVSAAASAQAPADSGRRNPVVAGVASYVLPGVGSWYAGNDRHAAVHGAIAAALGITGAVLAAGSECRDASCEGDRNVPLGLVVLAYLTNEIWSTVTAVRDAHAYNDRMEERRLGRVDIGPALRSVTAAGDAAGRRLELRLLRVVY